MAGDYDGEYNKTQTSFKLSFGKVSVLKMRLKFYLYL